MRLRRALTAALVLPALVALAAAAGSPAADAQVLPPPPAVPAPPEELEPLLTLLAPVGGTVTEPGCAAMGTVLGLGAVAVPGIPGTIEQQTGLPLSSLPVALQPELLTLVNTLLYVQSSGCGLLPLAAERTVCAADDDIAAQLASVRSQLGLPGSPVRAGDLVPVPPPTAGGVVDTFRTLATFGVPGAADVAAAMNDAGDCELRQRFTNLEPPPLPPDPTPGISPVAVPASPPGPAPAGSFTAPAGRVPAAPPTPSAATAPTAVAPASAPASLPIPLPTDVPGWLRLAVVAGLIAFIYRAVAPTRPVGPTRPVA